MHNAHTQSSLLNKQTTGKTHELFMVFHLVKAHFRLQQDVGSASPTWAENNKANLAVAK